MGLFTRLGDAELSDIAAAFGLGAIQRVQPILAGTINSNFVIETGAAEDASDRASWFIRVNEGKAEPDVAWEADLVAALAGQGVATPPPIAARDGKRYAPLPGTGKWVSVFPWRVGRHLGSDEVTAEIAGQLGGVLAGLHLAGLALPPALRRTSIYDHAHLVARYHTFAGHADPALGHAIAILGEELAFAGEHAAIRAAATHGIIHGDLFRDNVLWGAGPGAGITAVLDFEQASGGSLVYDLAVCLNDWCWTGIPRLDVAGALLAGYQRVRPLTQADREALVMEVRAAAARFTITRITDVYLAKVYNPDKDFRAFLARCEAWRGPALGQLSSLL
ncbi:MAG TPA: homoserine kinase [Kofleriaceae bacterium]